MSRCVCCGDVLTTFEMSRKKPDGEFEDMCGECRWFVFNADILSTREYAFEHLTEKLLENLPTDFIKESN